MINRWLQAAAAALLALSVATSAGMVSSGHGSTPPTVVAFRSINKCC